MQQIALVDLGMGNLRSVERALLRAAADVGAPCAVTRTGDPDVVARADKVVVPGQGAFRDCAAALGAGLGDALRAQIRAGTPYFGICLGLQALFQESEEAPGAAGLGVFAGAVERLTGGARERGERAHNDGEAAAEAAQAAGGPLVKIPHMGWNRVALSRDVNGPLRRFAGESPYMYFVHSYHAVPRDPGLIAATADHGPHRVTAAIERDNVTGTQFHPEKSQDAGLRLLAAFVSV